MAGGYVGAGRRCRRKEMVEEKSLGVRVRRMKFEEKKRIEQGLLLCPEVHLLNKC